MNVSGSQGKVIIGRTPHSPAEAVRVADRIHQVVREITSPTVAVEAATAGPDQPDPFTTGLRARTGSAS